MRDRVAQKRPRLQGSLEKGVVVSSDETRLAIGIREADVFIASQLSDPENLAAIREIGQELFGPDFQIVIESLPDEEPKAAAGEGAEAGNAGESTKQDRDQSKLAFKQAVVEIFQRTSMRSKI